MRDTPLAELFALQPYSLRYEDKWFLLKPHLARAFDWHIERSAGFRRFCESRGVKSGADIGELATIPGLPVAAFKQHSTLLTSVAEDSLTGRLASSATSGVPSVVAVDRETSRLQVRALAAVLGDIFGAHRRPFLVMDADPRTGSAGSARAAATRGFLNLASSVSYGLEERDGRLVVNIEAIAAAFDRARSLNEPIVVFGFTFVLYADVLRPLADRGFRASLPVGSHLAHIGGWKRLAEQAVSRETFTNLASEVLGIRTADVVDFYGFTEQMGVTYPDVGNGEHICPIFADILVRDPRTLEVVPDGREGVLQFVTPLPRSYAGISVLTDDVGVITMRDGVAGHRAGTLFRVLGRLRKAEVRGCGDIMGDRVLRAVSRGREDAPKASVNGARMIWHSSHSYAPSTLDAPTVLSTLPRVDDLHTLVQRLRQNRSVLDQYSTSELIALIGAAAKRWMASDSPLAPLRQQGLAFLSSWCEPSRMAAMVTRSLGRPRGVLDGARAEENSTRRLILASPRGLVAHWLAGNVPLLGMLALAQSIVTRNANLLKAASSNTSVLPLLLEAFRGLVLDVGGGRLLRGDDILSTIAIVYFDREDEASAAAMSSEADVRVAWGGREAIESVGRLPKRVSTEDIILGPKLSFAVVGRESLQSELSVKRHARRLSVDVCVFDQYACASPHVVFVEQRGAVPPERFGALLADELEKTSRRIPKGPVDEGTATAIRSARLGAELTGRLWGSDDLDWTVLLLDRVRTVEPTYSRVITVVPVEDCDEVLPMVSRDIQTIGLALENGRAVEFARKAALAGADRFPMLGRMTFFDSPWDGMFIAERLVRWISIGGPY